MPAYTLRSLNFLSSCFIDNNQLIQHVKQHYLLCYMIIKCVSLREEHRLKVFEKKILSKYLDPRRMRMGNRESFVMRNSVICIIHPTLSGILNLGDWEGAGHVAWMEYSRNAFKFLIVIPTCKKPLESLDTVRRIHYVGSCRSRNRKDELDPVDWGQGSVESFRECRIEPPGSLSHRISMLILGDRGKNDYVNSHATYNDLRSYEERQTRTLILVRKRSWNEVVLYIDITYYIELKRFRLLLL